MYPLKMIPAFKDYLWGGTRLRDVYHKPTALDPVAESWEISCHPDGPSRVGNGAPAGRELPDVLAEHPEWMGRRCAGRTEFPLLVKLIDAKQALSIQVHPANDYARRVENQLGKNEMWYVVDAEPGAELVLGFAHPIGREEMRERIAQGTLTEVTRSVPVQRGDCYCIPAGMLHAIGAGTLIAEIQQSSNVTYRVFDYGRRGSDGKLRELHIDKALDVTDTALQAVNTGHGGPVLTDWEFFQAELVAVNGCGEIHCGEESFRCLLVVEGALRMRTPQGMLALRAGESAFLPAGLGGVRLEGDAKALVAHL